MTARTIEELRTKFETGDRPTAADFVDLIDSFLHAGLSNFPNPLPAVSGKNLTNIGDALPAVLPARDASELLNISPEEYNVLTGVVPNYVSATSFNVAGDRTSQFRPGQRIRITSGGVAFYTSVDSAAYAAGPDLTTVNNLDSFPSNQLADVALGVVSPAHLGGAVDEATVGFRRGVANLVAAAALNLPADGYSFDVDGNAGIGAISARAAGRIVRLTFNSNPKLTHGAALSLRGARDYWVYPGDVLDLESLGGGNWREVRRSAEAVVGYAQLTLDDTAPGGWLLLNDGSIGNAASGATARANADTQALFELIWAKTLAAWCPTQDAAGTPVARGASAAADFNANRRLVLPRALGRALAAAGAGSGLTARALAEYLGAETHVLTSAEMPVHSHGLTDPGHTHGTDAIKKIGTLDQMSTGGPVDDFDPASINSATTGITIGNAGGGTAHPNMQPSLFLNVMVKL